MPHRERVTVFRPAGPLAAVLDSIGDDVERVFLCGAGDGAAAARAWAADVPDGWRQAKRGHYLEGQFPIFRFSRADGTGLEVLRAAAWFGAGAGVEECAAAWEQLRQDAPTWADEGAILSTPATTGRYLLMRVTAFDAAWPVLDDETQSLIRSTSGQGRIELFDRGRELPGIVEYDGRFSYAALLWGLAGGVPKRDKVDEYAGQVRGRYRVTAAVPAGWGHVGLLGTKDGAGGWRWPAEPGETFETWADGAELGIALAQGWRVRIHERILWPTYSTRGPLDSWGERLRRAYTDYKAAGRNLEARAVRAIVLQAVGAFHGRPHRATRVGTADEVPAGAAGLRMEGDAFLWGEGESQGWPEMAHPEWSAAIWARARARLLVSPTGRRDVKAGALAVPASTVLAFRTDAVYMTSDPTWPDDGQVGRLRRAWVHPRPVQAPKNQRELLNLKGQ